MKNTFFVGAGAALMYVGCATANADMVDIGNGSTNGDASVPSSITQVFGTIGDGSGTGGRGGSGPYSGTDLFGGTGSLVNPIDAQGMSGRNAGGGPAMAPLPPAVISGLIGLAAVGLIAKLRRRSLEA